MLRDVHSTGNMSNALCSGLLLEHCTVCGSLSSSGSCAVTFGWGSCYSWGSPSGMRICCLPPGCGFWDGDGKLLWRGRKWCLTRSSLPPSQVMLVGDSGVGKTCLLVRFKDGAFLAGSFISTVGIDFRVSQQQLGSARLATVLAEGHHNVAPAA